CERPIREFAVTGRIEWIFWERWSEGLFDGPARAGHGRRGWRAGDQGSRRQVPGERGLDSKAQAIEARNRQLCTAPAGVSHATKLDNDLPRLEQLVKERPDATLKELRTALGCEASVSCIWRAPRRLQMTFKKSSAGRGAAAAG